MTTFVVVLSQKIFLKLIKQLFTDIVCCDGDGPTKLAGRCRQNCCQVICLRKRSGCILVLGLRKQSRTLTVRVLFYCNIGELATPKCHLQSLFSVFSHIRSHVLSRLTGKAHTGRIQQKRLMGLSVSLQVN